MKRGILGVLAGLSLILTGCSSHRPLPTVTSVDLQRFMGDWYVIAHIPTFIETEAFDAVESYALNPDGSIATTFTFREGSHTGETKAYHPTGYVQANSGNATWAMQFIWPFTSEYLIGFLSDDYQVVVIARSARDYVWLMARTPTPNETQVAAALDWIEKHDYDVSKLRRIPHGPQPLGKAITPLASP